MRLRSCHIENFGALHEKDILFPSSLVSFCEKNGYGKTTIAAFLKAMFYGLESDRANGTFNERRHFYPFTGGTFGGNLTFEANGTLYKIERFFDEKSETKDSFTLYVNGKLQPSDENFAQKLFGIDKQSFERTIFLSSEDIEIASTGDINQKLNCFLEGGEESNFENALKILEDKRKEYKKSRGEGGLLSETKQKLNSLSEQMTNVEQIFSSLKEKYAKSEALEGEIQRLSEKIKKAMEEGVVFSNWEVFDGLTKEAEEDENKLSAIQKRYPFPLPPQDEIEREKERERKVSELLKKLEERPFSFEEEASFRSLQELFYKSPLEEERLKSVRDMIEDEKKLSFELSAAEPPLSERETKLKKKFSSRLPSKEERAALKEKLARFEEIEEREKSTEEFVEKSEKTPERKGKFLFIAIFSFLLLAGGIGGFFLSNILGIALLVCGILGLLLDGFFYLNQKTNQKKSDKIENPEKKALKEKKEALKGEISSYLLAFQASLDGGLSFAAASFLKDCSDFEELLLKESEEKERKETLLSSRESVQREIESFFSPYPIDGEKNYMEKLQTLLMMQEKLSMFSAREKAFERDKTLLKEEIKRESEALSLFCDRFSLPKAEIREELKEMEEDKKELDRLTFKLQREREKAENFKREKNLTLRPLPAEEDFETLKSRLVALQGEQNRLKIEISKDEREAETLDDLKSEYETYFSALEQYKREYDLYTKTIESLKQADESLKEAYLKPVKDSFLFYSDALEKALGEKVILNNFEIRYERGGKERSEKHLSSGQRALVALCFRLALIENMYRDEKPFLILDDPFPHLDETHLENAKKLLERLSEKFQIIYFSCHESRAL